MEPPIQVLYLRSGGAYILILISFKANFLTSESRRSPKPLQSVDPPDSTTLEYSDFLRSRSARLMESTITWWIPRYSWPMSSGWNRISGALNRSAPNCKTT